MTSRRTFLLNIIPAAAGLSVLGSKAFAAAPAVDEKDPQAASLGYKADASKVDKAKFPKFTAKQSCSTCQLFQGKTGDATGPCPIFAGKVVAAKGWCSAYVPKA